MPYALVILGVLLLVTAVRGTQGDLWSLLKSEFSGTNSFVVWASAFLILGMIGYIKTVRPATDALMMLVLFALIVKNRGGFFDQFNQAIRNPVAPAGGASAVPALGTPGSAVPPAGTSTGVAPSGNAYLDNVLTGLQGIQ